MTENGYVQKHYGMLRFIASLLKVLAWGALGGFGLMALVALATAAGAPFTQFRNAGLLGFVLFILYGAGAFLLLHLFAESIQLFLDMEENTRAMRRDMDVLREESTRTTSAEHGVSVSLPAQPPTPAPPLLGGDTPLKAETPAAGGPSFSGHGPSDT